MRLPRKLNEFIPGSNLDGTSPKSLQSLRLQAFFANTQI
jgi:hypothetical protein